MDERGADGPGPQKATISKLITLPGMRSLGRNVAMQSEPAKVAQPDYPVDFARWDTCQEFLARSTS